MRKRTTNAKSKVAVNTGATLLVALLAGGAAFARPGRIEPPPAQPPPEGASPATNQEAPPDPQDPPDLPPPTGKPCTEGPNQSVCDEGHPGNPAGDKPGNKPGDAWFQDMATQMFDVQQSLDPMITWSGPRDKDIRYFAQWLQSVIQQYYAIAYDRGAVPKMYPFGRMTRGDYNYYYYYWIQPIYYNLLYQVADYKREHPGDSSYLPYLGPVAREYHDLARCNFGFNGNDRGALEDSEAYEVEAAAGLRARP